MSLILFSFSPEGSVIWRSLMLDVIDFISCKEQDGRLANMNISINVTDDFMRKLKDGTPVSLISPDGGKRVKDIDPRELWSRLADMAHKSADPGVIFIDNVNKYNPLVKDFVVEATNPCGEQPMPAFNCCNLSAINIHKFCIADSKGNFKFDFNGLYQTSKIVMRFMDNLIDVMAFPDDRFKDNVHKFRPVGIGMMGFADSLFELGLRYDGPDGRKFGADIMRTMTTACVEASAEMAQERGAFHNYERYKDDIIRIVREHTDNNKDVMEKVEKYGLRNNQFTTAQPTGCLIGDTLISSNKFGVSEIKNLSSEMVENTKTKSDNGEYTFKNWYNQGVAKTIKIKTKRGYELQGTYNHKVRIINENGYIWKKLEEIEKNDHIVMRKNFIFDSFSNNVDTVIFEIAECIGLYMADGWFHGGVNGTGRGGRLLFSINKKDIDYARNLINKSLRKIDYGFNLIEREYGDDQNCVRIDISSKKLYDWFLEHKCIKNGAQTAFIPDIVFENRETLQRFIKGFFKGDGHITKRDQCIGFTTVSKRLAKQLHTILLGLGFPSRIDYYPVGEGEKIKIGDREINVNFDTYKIALNNYYSHLLGLKLGIKIDLLGNSNKYEKILITESEKKFLSKVVLPAYHKKIKEPFSFVSFDKYRLSKLNNWFWDNELLIEQIDSKEYCESENVYDMEIQESGHTYVANGFVTHNTTAISCDCSYGIEPAFGLVFTKNLMTGETMTMANPIFEKKFKKEPWYTTQLIEKICSNGGSLKGLHGIPREVKDVFVAAHDIKYKERIDMQSELQRYCSTAISSTVNLPKEITKEEIYDLFIYAHEKNLKGITIYRDGCKKFQPVSFTKDEDEHEFKRPNKLNSETFKIETGNGTMYVTVTDDGGKPVEVFLFLGKSGQTLNTFTEALGRLLSLSLQSDVPLEKLTKTLIGINSDMSVWHRFEDADQRPTQILSIPDGIAKLLNKYYVGKEIVVSNGGEKCPKCEGVMSATEGCFSCASCGYSKCS